MKIAFRNKLGLSKQCKKLIDGRGKNRIVNIMERVSVGDL